MKSRIHVNRHHIAANRKHGANLPPFTVKNYKCNRRGHRVVIHGDSEMVYSPDKPLSCGAVAWIETTAEVTVE